jgi:predicted esterase
VDASGAVFVPVGADGLPLLSIQHGTQTHRSAVASVSAALFGMEGIVAASTGYLACMPDYLGFGESEGLHPFLHARSAANAVIDMLRATRHVADDRGIALDGKLFLLGYSQGGHVTLSAQREMEGPLADEFTLTGVVSMSGPTDLLATARDIIGRPFYGHPGFVAYVVAAYDSVYGWNRLGEILSEPYASLVPTLFDGTRLLDDIDDELPATMSALFDPSFRDRFLAGAEADMDMALVENSPLDWTPRAPIRLYHGTADEIVPYGNAVAAENALGRERGGDVQLTTLYDQDHEGGIFAAIDLAFAWLESLR